MSTATGQYAFNFNGQSDQNPFSNANFTAVLSPGTGQILSNLFQHDSGFNHAIYAYNGTSGAYAGTPVTSKFEVHASGVGDSAVGGCLDENKTGFLLEINGTAYRITYYLTGTQNDIVTSGTLGSFTADDLFEITVTKGSPNTLSCKQNGSTITLTTSTYTATLSNMTAVFGLFPDNTGATSVKSFAVDGLSGGSATYQPMIYQRKTLYFI